MNKSGNNGGGIAGGIIGIVVLIVGLILVKNLIPTIFKLVFWIVIIVILAIIGLLVLIVILANKASKSKNQGSTKDAGNTQGSAQAAADADGSELTNEQKGILSSARVDLMNLRRVVMGIHIFDVREKANEVTAQIDKILQTLKEKPEKIPSTRQCLNYYIPTLNSVLTNFSNLDSKGQLTDEMKEKTKTFLTDVKAALVQHYSNLFNEDKLDMEVDMEAMTIALKRDGLLQQDEGLHD